MINTKKVYALKNGKGEDVAYITSDNNCIVLNLTKMWGRPLLLDSEVTSGFNLDDFAGSINPKNSARMSAILRTDPYYKANPPYVPLSFQSLPASADKVVMIMQSPDPDEAYATIRIVTPLYEKVVAEFESIEDVTGKVTIVY